MRKTKSAELELVYRARKNVPAGKQWCPPPTPTKNRPHKAAVVGDTLGDPFKDTVGPSIHVLIKLLSTITLIAVPFLF